MKDYYHDYKKENLEFAIYALSNVKNSLNTAIVGFRSGVSTRLYQDALEELEDIQYYTLKKDKALKKRLENLLENLPNDNETK